jgi:hypothetical protein
MTAALWDSAQWFLTLHADACRIAGQFDAALGHLAQAQRLVEQTEDRWYRAEALRLRGDVLAAMGDGAGAEASYRKAIAIAQRQRAKLWELRAAMSLAKLWRNQNKRAEAHALLVGVLQQGFGSRVGTPADQPSPHQRDSHGMGMREPTRLGQCGTLSRFSILYR